MKSDYWNVTDEQVIEKTGKPIGHWTGVLDRFGATGKKPGDSVNHLQKDHDVPRYWARTLTTGYLKAKGVASTAAEDKAAPPARKQAKAKE